MKVVFKPLINFSVGTYKPMNVLFFPTESVEYRKLLVPFIDYILKIVIVCFVKI